MSCINGDLISTIKENITLSMSDIAKWVGIGLEKLTKSFSCYFNFQIGRFSVSYFGDFIIT